MATMAPPSEYEEDAARIDDEYVPDSATTEAEIQAALSAAGFPEASQSHIEDWLVSEEDAWDVVGPDVQDAGSVRREIDRESGGTVSESRAEAMAESIGSEIQSARAEAAQRVTDDGQVRTEDGRFVGKLQNVEEQVREDGIYYRNRNTGTEGRAASFDKST
jgi:hypothetical protein